MLHFVKQYVNNKYRVKKYFSKTKEVIMKFSKELQEFINKELEECEREEREGKVKYLSEEEAFEIMFGNFIHEKKI